METLMPNQLIRMAYASKATFMPFNVEKGVEGNVANILKIARRNNRKNNLVGALYYGNGCFFQCLEGRKQDIDALYAKLEKDLRHTDLQVLSVEPIKQVGFLSWEMKYAAIDQEVRIFLKSHQLGKFDPYRFTPEMTAELITVLQTADDGIAADELNEANLSNQPTINTGVSMTMLWLAIIISIVATALITQWLISLK